jgi:RNA polymerase-binding protein DksA
MKRGKTPLLTVEAYRAILLAKKAELTSAPSPAAPGLAEFGRVAEDDQAPVLHDQFISFQVKSLDYQMLKQIDAALDRLARGGFGVCAACGEDISPKRLAAIPWAHCCITCQERTGSAGAAASADQQAA